MHYLGEKEVIRINYNDTLCKSFIKLEVNNGTFSFEYEGKTFSLNDIDAVWYRKGKNWLCDQFFPVSIKDHCRLTTYLNHKLLLEETRLAEYVHHLIEHFIPAIGTSNRGDLNKLLVLKAAREVGLLVPDFQIVKAKKNLLEGYTDLPLPITKPMADGLYLFDYEEKNRGYFTYTELLNHDAVADLPDIFSPSFVQKNIHKKYELRVFMLYEKCYAMAILSQNDEQTKVDFRKYNEKKPNRCVPYLLPKEIAKKIRSLFKKLHLNTGSVDMIVDKENNFYFLEINPVGEFSMVSIPCNYFLEKQIALKLIENGRIHREKKTSRNGQHAVAVGV